VLVEDAPVISATGPLHLEGMSFDEVVVAIPAKRYLQVSSVLDGLQDLGKPSAPSWTSGRGCRCARRCFRLAACR